MKNFLQFCFCFVFLQLVASQVQTSCSVNKALPEQYVTTDQNLYLPIYEYFAGDNLQFNFLSASSSNVPIQLIPAIQQSLTASYSFPQIINFKVYKPHARAFSNSLTILFNNNAKFYVQSYSFSNDLQFTPDNDPILITLETPQQQNLTQSCYDLEYYTNSLLIVDCFNGIYNKLVTVSLKENQVVSNSTSIALSKNNFQNRKIFVLDYWQLQKSYLLRAVQDVNDSYIEIFRIQEKQSIVLKFNSMPPINSLSLTLKNTNFSINNFQIAGKYLIFSETYSQTIFKIQMDLKFMNYTTNIFNQFLLPIQILGISSYYDGETLKLVIADKNGGTNAISLIDWTYYQPVTICTTTKLDLALQNVVKILQTSKFVVLVYQKNSPSYGSYLIILRKHNKIGENFPIIYQSPLYTQSFLFDLDPLQNNLLMIFSNQTQQMLKITDPQFSIAQQAQSMSSATVQIQCMGYLNTLQSSSVTPTFSSQASQSVDIQFYASNSIYIIQKKSGTIGAQQLTTNAPGETIFGVSEFYYGPALSYTIQDSTNQGFAKNSSATIYKTYNIVSNSTFTFPFGSSNIQLIKSFQMMGNYFYWIVECNNGKIYDYGQDQNTLNFETGAQISQQSFITSNLINYYYIYPYIQIYLEQKNQCTVYFKNMQSSLPYFSLTVCDGQSYKIQDIILINYDLFILADPQNTDSSNGQILKVQITNSSLQNALKFSQIPKILIKKSSFVTGQTLSSFIPLNIIQDWTKPNIYYIQCIGQVIIADLNYYHIYSVISLPTGLNEHYQIAVTKHSLFIITGIQIIEYSIRELDNIVLLRQNIPNYSSNDVSYSISKSLIAFTKEILIIFENNAKQIIIINQSQRFAFNVIRDIQTLVSIPISLITTFNSDLKVIQLQVFYQNQGIDIYQIYLEEFASFKGYQTEGIFYFLVENQLASNKQQQKFNFDLVVSSKFGQSTQVIPIIDCSITMNYVNTSISVLSNSQQVSQITIPAFSNGNDFYSFFFSSKVYFSGPILNYSIDCEQKSECNNQIMMQGIIDKNKYLSTNTEFFALAKGSNNFTYAQSENKIFRLGNYDNKFYDYVQLPFYNLYKYCTKLVSDPTDLYTISACSDFESSWTLYFSSFISSEPHLLGQITIQEPQFIYKMYLQANQLFVVDAANDLSTFNGIHIYKLNFIADFDPVTFSLPQYVHYQRTFHLEYFGFKKNITSFDIISKTNLFLFAFGLADGTVQFVEYQPNAINSEYIFQKAFSINILSYIKQKDEELSNKNSDFFPYLNGIKLFNYKSAYNQIEAVFIFKFFHSYDLIFSYQQGETDFSIIPFYKLMQYAFYESQNNVETIDFTSSTNYGENISSVLFSGYLPSYLNNQNNNYSSHILFAYNKKVDSSQANMIAPAFYELEPSGGYAFKTQRQFIYQIQSYQGISTTNTSITLVNPDDYTFQSFCLNKNPSILFKADNIESAWVKVFAQSLFHSSNYTFSINSQNFSKKKDHKLWIIGVVLGSVALLVIAIIMLVHYRRKIKNVGLALNEEQEQ